MAHSSKRQAAKIYDRLINAGITYDDAVKLRSIAMTLQRWHEGECGNSNDHASWQIVRGHKPDSGEFQHDDNGKSFEFRIVYGRASLQAEEFYTPIPDRERGAHKRLSAIMARYPDLTSYIQSDPRGAALYILRPGDVPIGQRIDECYGNGIAVW